MSELKKNPLFRFLSSYGLSIILLFLLLVLTYLGTWEQTTTGIYKVQKKYFESIFLVHYAFGTWRPSSVVDTGRSLTRNA